MLALQGSSGLAPEGTCVGRTDTFLRVLDDDGDVHLVLPDEFEWDWRVPPDDLVRSEYFACVMLGKEECPPMLHKRLWEIDELAKKVGGRLRSRQAVAREVASYLRERRGLATQYRVQMTSAMQAWAETLTKKERAEVRSLCTRAQWGGKTCYTDASMAAWLDLTLAFVGLDQQVFSPETLQGRLDEELGRLLDALVPSLLREIASGDFDLIGLGGKTAEFDEKLRDVLKRRMEPAQVSKSVTAADSPGRS
jgi:hypothetical protein